MVKFTADELVTLQDCASRIWNEIGGDCLQVQIDCDGKTEVTASMSRAAVIEVMLDAGRFEETLRSRGFRERVSEELMKRWEAVSYEEKKVAVKPAFQYARYGF